MSTLARILLRLAGQNRVTIKAATFLGGTLFGTFRTAIEGSTFEGSTKLNVCSLDKAPRIMTRLRDAGFQLDVEESLVLALRARQDQTKSLVESASARLEAAEAVLAARGLNLYGFQRGGVKWLASRTGALLADEMGLGKTIQTLVSLPENMPVLVVAPAVAKGVWARECARWRPDLRVSVLSGRNSFRWPEKGEMVVINYDILPNAFGPCVDGTTLVADEAHALKNFKAKRTEKFKELSNAVRQNNGRTWLLTATPLLNRPPELWAILSAAGLEREVFGTWKTFVECFQGVKDRWGGWLWGMPSSDVPARLARAMLRRLRVEVLPDLPVKTWRDLDVEIDASTLKSCDAIVRMLEEDGTSIQDIEEKVLRTKLKFSDFSTVREALSVAKIPAMLAIVEDFEEQDEPLIVFSAHRAPIDILADREGWAVITGDTKPEERTRIEERFQRGELRGVGATIDAGGVAITLTRASHALFVDRDWTPALNSQAEDRICRIGQTRGCVITNLVATHKLDKRVTELLTIKTALATATLATNGEATPAVESFDIDSLLPSESDVASSSDNTIQAPKAPPPSSGKMRASASTPQEQWAYKALLTLADLDSDRASEKNDVGFNKLDGSFGHSLATQALRQGLTPKQWAVAIKLCRKYHRQVGECP